MPQGSAANPLVGLFPIFLIFIIFYFLLIRPQQKKELAHRKMLDTLKKNDEVVTTAGIYGTVVNVKDKTVVVRVDDNAKIEFDKTSITQILRQKQA